MKLTELFEDVIVTDVTTMLLEFAKPIWRRQGGKIIRGFRCTQGRKQGQIVSNPATCSGKVDLKKRIIMKKLQSTKGRSLRRKAKRTKTKNPISRRLQALNRMAGKK